MIMDMLVLLVKFNRVYIIIWMNNFCLVCFFLLEYKVYGIFEKKMIILIIVEYKFKLEEKILL